MTKCSLAFRRFSRNVACILLPPVLICISLVMLIIQFSELSTKAEILSLSSFIVLLSFSALAFNWCRVSPAFVAQATLASIYNVGVDSFLASLFALVATFFAWLKVTFSTSSSWSYLILFALHWLFLLFSILLFLTSLLHLLKAVREEDSA